MKFRLLIFMAFFCFLNVRSQKRTLPLSAEAVISSLDENEVVSLNVKAYSAKLEDELSQKGIKFRRHPNHFYTLYLGKQKLGNLNELEAIRWIEPIGGSGLVLNDSMLANNRVLPVHSGMAPLRKSYSGKGVVIGFIDTGIDFTHKDFQDSTGKTRVLKIWDQAADTLVSSRIPQWNYGQVWDSSDINAGACPHDDDILSHGTNVAGIASGNGLALNKLKGVAPESDIIMVASDFSSQNWLNTVADAVEFIFLEAEKLGKPCVINISAGDYLGSHDARDLAAIRIDSMIKAKRGRSVVAAAGNAGHVKFHLGYTVGSDTNFTWFRYQSNTIAGAGVYFQLWADTNEFNVVNYSVGAHLNSGSYARRGILPFRNISNCLNTVVSDTLYSFGGQVLSPVLTFAQQMGDKYFMEVFLPSPDSSAYHFAFFTTGSGNFDVWSDSWLGLSHMVQSPLPSLAVLPEIANYKKPDTLKTIVSSFTCSPNVITVANYTNRDRYYDFNNTLQVFPVTVGERTPASSIGPDRRGNQKPDVIASGDLTLTANRLASIPLHLANNQADRIAQGGMHKRNGGTSMAAPVVAGIAALMMEECHMLSAGEIKSRIIQNVYTDSLTGNVPSYTHGYGKPDAFASVQSLFFVSEISGPDTVAICEGEMATLSGPSGMTNYFWSTGDSVQSIQADSAGWYYLESSDSASCRSGADSVFVIVNPNPPEPSITFIDASTLESSLAPSYQWYRNNLPISGANARRLSISNNGHYSVEVADSNDCKTMSDSALSYLGTGELNDQDIWRIYPNPSFDGDLFIESSSEFFGQIWSVEVLNLNGQVVLQTKPEMGPRRKVSGLPEGQYLLRAIHQNGIETLGIILVTQQRLPEH